MKVALFDIVRSWSRRRKIVTALLTALAGVLLYTGISVWVYVAQHPGDPFQQNLAAWARNNHLGSVVDRLEGWLHSKPPSTKPAESLALKAPAVTTAAPAPSTDPVSVTASTAPPASPDTASTGASGANTAPATSAPATSTTVAGPVSIKPAVFPPLPGEGEWQVTATIGNTPVIWATSLRPLRKYGSVVATAALLEVSKLRAALFNGKDIPGKGSFKNYSRVPAKAVPSLVATFNGGFRMEHFWGGYMTEGRTIRRLQKNDATLAIDKEGRLHLGVWGKDLKPSDQWISIRQNLPPVVMDGEVSFRKFSGIYWGDDVKKETFTFRSAICTLADGRLMYTAMGKVDIGLLATALVNMGCQTAMELDINGNWPSFVTYTDLGADKRDAVLLDKRMSNARRYLRRSDKDFFALFDPALLPKGVVH